MNKRQKSIVTHLITHAQKHDRTEIKLTAVPISLLAQTMSPSEIREALDAGVEDHLLACIAGGLAPVYRLLSPEEQAAHRRAVPICIACQKRPAREDDYFCSDKCGWGAALVYYQDYHWSATQGAWVEHEEDEQR